MKVVDPYGQLFRYCGLMKRAYGLTIMALTACGGGDSSADAYLFMDAPGPLDSPIIGNCPVFPGNNIFNTPIGALPVDSSSDAYIGTIGGTRTLHLDLGQTIDPQSDTYYGIPYNVVSGASFGWPQIAFFAVDTQNYSWIPANESECGNAQHDVVSPCTIGGPQLPIPGTPLVEG